MTVEELAAELDTLPPGAQVTDGNVRAIQVTYRASYDIVVIWFGDGEDA